MDLAEVVEEGAMSQVEANLASGSVTSSEKHHLDVNIVSIVIGALIIISILAWVAAIKSICEHTIEDDRKDRYKETYRKFVSAFIVTVVSAFIVLLIYVGYTNR
jgi:uncharacterized membrane protein YidH (DUF202 family)